MCTRPPKVQGHLVINVGVSYHWKLLKENTDVNKRLVVAHYWSVRF